MYIGWIDYAVLILLLSLSIGIGIYHGCIRSKQLTTGEFLVANGQMKILPTAISLMASIMSAATLLGAPAEIYSFGTMLLYTMFSWLIGTYLTAYLFIPMYRRIGSFSIYAYLEQRFSLPVRLVVTSVYILNNLLYMSVILYGPSLALSQVTGLHIWMAVGSCGFICTIYTSIGGMKAVIWTDVAQVVTMFLGLILSIVFGLIDVGGVGEVYRKLIEGNRLQLANFNVDPSIRYTCWSILIGNSLYTTAVCSCVQTQAQRYMCVKDKKAAQRVAWISGALSALIILLCGYVGCIIYAKYSQCDPLQAQLISKPDQLYPLFVIQTLGRFPGLTGLFIASIMSASLSSISSGVNSIATVLLEDIYRRLRTSHAVMSDEQQAFISKILSTFIGILTMFLAYLVSYMRDNILVIVIQFSGSFITPILGIFLLGFFVARVNSRSVLIGFLLCLVFQTWILLGANLTTKYQVDRSGRLPTSIDGCVPRVNSTRPVIMHHSDNPFLRLYSISVHWYAFNGVFLTSIFGLLASFVFGSKNPKSLDKALLISWRDIFGCGSMKRSELSNTGKEASVSNEVIENERML